MWKCPNCKTTNETNICRSCSFDLSKDYTTHRSLCQLSKSSSKIFKPTQPGDNILMASSDTDYVFGRKMDRTKITTIYFRNKKENIGEDAWDVSEKQNGSIMAWTEEKRDGFMDLYLAANGNILANKDCSMLFTRYENLKKFVGLQYFRTDQTEDMHGMFFDCRQLKSLNLKKMDTGNVTNMSHMFNLCLHLQSLNLEKLHTDQVMDMSAMFAGCSELKELDLGSFDTSNVKNMDMMFFLCKSLEKLNISSFDTGNVESMEEMFKGCISLGELDVNHFDTSKIANMTSFSEYTKLPDNVALKSADNILMASSDIDYIFGKEMDRKQIKTIYFRNRKKGIGENAWDVSEKQDGSIMAWMEEKEGLSDLYIAANGNIKANKDCTNLFGNYSSLENIYGMEYFRTNDTENMEMMFVACNSLQSIDVSGFDTSRVVSMAWMFAGCVSLQNIDVSHFNTASVGTMSDMFFGCDSLQSLDIRNFVIHDFWTMHEPFAEHIGLPKQVPLKRNRPAKVKKLRNSTIWKLAEQGETEYLMKMWEDKIIVPRKSDKDLPEWYSKDDPSEFLEYLKEAAASGEKTAQRELCAWYEKSSPEEAYYWKKRAETRFLTPLDDGTSSVKLRSDQEYRIALDYDLKTRRDFLDFTEKSFSCVNSVMPGGMSKEEFLSQREIAEKNKRIWLRKAAEDGNAEAQYYLGILLYPNSDYDEKLGTWSEADEAERAMLTLNGSLKKGSVEEALGWLRQARANGNWAAHEALTQVSLEEVEEVAEESFRPQKPTKKAGLFTRFFGEKTQEKPVERVAEKKVPFLSVDWRQSPEFLGLCKLAKEGEREAQMFVAKEYGKRKFWKEALTSFVEAAWKGDPQAMEYAAEYYAEGKGTEKNLSEAFFWYERAMRRGQTRMEDPAKDLSDEEKETLLSSEQKFILELDDEVKAYERYRAEGDAEDVDLSDL